jgi:hypothetical protein
MDSVITVPRNQASKVQPTGEMLPRKNNQCDPQTETVTN